jgi:hypothetical protein
VTAPDCRSPATCPVPDPGAVDLRRLRLAHLEPGRVLDRVFPTAHGVLGFNDSGEGDTRFAPLSGMAHLYAGDTRTVALLETVFHNVHQAAPRLIFAATDLAGRSLGRVRVEARVPLVDLRDGALARLGLQRWQLTATSAAHYPCTRAWARVLSRRRIGGVAPRGLLWHSRVAELAADDSPLLADLLEGTPSEACVLYEGVGIALSDHGGGLDDLGGASQGRLLIDQIAEHLNATVL